MSDDSYFTEFVLPSGLTVYYRYADIPWFRALIGVQVGNRDDPPGMEGVAHLLEHQLSSGTQGLPLMNSTELERWIVEHRFQLNHGVTGIDETVYAAKAEVRRARDLFDFFHRFVFLPRLDTGFEHDRKIVRHERERRVARRREATRAMDRAIFGSHRLATVEGCPEDVGLNALTSYDVQTMHRRYYHYKNARMVVVGGLDVADLERVLCEIYALHYDDRDVRLQPPGISFGTPEPRVYHSRVLKDAESVSVTYVWSLDPLARRSAYGLVLLRNILWRLLFDRLRVQEELVYSVNVPVSILIDHASLRISTDVSPGNVDRVRAVIEHTMRDVDGARAILEECRKGTALSILFEDNGVEDTMDEAVHQIKIFGSVISPEKRASLFQSLEEHELGPFVDWLAPERAYVELYEH